jgi:hypothetical protein
MMLYLTPSIIQSLALKLYSAVPHSMADERTVSVITWMNPALRNLEKVNTIFSFAQIRGWYRDEAKQKALSDGTAKVCLLYQLLKFSEFGLDSSCCPTVPRNQILQHRAGNSLRRRRRRRQDGAR